MKNIILNSVLSVLVAFQLTGCGTLLYPERRGQKAGRLDAGVVFLDAVGLLFFLVPGAIAFVIDFTNGTIYLPASSQTNNNADIKQVKFDPARKQHAQIERIIERETGKHVSFNKDDIKITRLHSIDEIPAILED